MKKIVLCLSLLFAFALTSCANSIMQSGSGNLKKEERTIGVMNGVMCECSADITITEGTSDKVEIETDDDILPLIETRLFGGKLSITSKENIRPTALRVKLQIKDATTFLMNGSGFINAVGNFKGDNVHFGINGSGDINFNSIEANNIKVEIAGSGNVMIKGKTDKNYVEITGSGNANCFDLESRATKVEIMGSGNSFVAAEKELYISIMGSGDVEYKGSPTDFSAKSVGSGKIRKSTK